MSTILRENHEEVADARDNMIHILRALGPRTLEQKRLPLDSLVLDPQNVRFRHVNRSLSDREAEDILWKDSDTKVLYQEILAAGGLSEPIYVRPHEGKFLVKAGNRRVVCLRHAHQQAEKGALKG